MKVSVCTITYNQESFISKAIQSALMQEVDFEIEIVIADDCSTDSTREIISQYANKYPNIIKPIFQSQNVGAGLNSVSCLEACTGEYIAILEGDDYWIDSKKLQNQIDFLEANQEYTLCFTRTYELYGEELILPSINPWLEKKTFSIIDLSIQNFIHTPSVVFRNFIKENRDNLPVWFAMSPVGDYVLHMLNARAGLIIYFPQITTVYRKQVGTWSSRPVAGQMLKFIEVINYLLTLDFENNIVKYNLVGQRKNSLLTYCNIMLDKNDFSFLDLLSKELKEESPFVKDLILQVYPNRIKSITHSNTYKIVSSIVKFFSNRSKLLR